jgi:hypothetical protein
MGQKASILMKSPQPLLKRLQKGLKRLNWELGKLLKRQ